MRIIIEMTIKKEDAFIFFLANAHPKAMREKRGRGGEPDRCQTVENHHTHASPMEVLLLARVGDTVV
jgi:hypothetical protein